MQDELLDVVYWVRQVLAVLQGLIWGAVPLTGLLAFLGCARRACAERAAAERGAWGGGS